MRSPLPTREPSKKTSLANPACYHISPPLLGRGKTEFRSLHMNWVLVADAKGNSRLQMHWLAD
jgi:hypothetical protein